MCLHPGDFNAGQSPGKSRIGISVAKPCKPDCNCLRRVIALSDRHFASSMDALSGPLMRSLRGSISGGSQSGDQLSRGAVREGSAREGRCGLRLDRWRYAEAVVPRPEGGRPSYLCHPACIAGRNREVPCVGRDDEARAVGGHARKNRATAGRGRTIEHDLVQKRSKFPDGVFEQWKVWIRH